MASKDDDGDDGASSCSDLSSPDPDAELDLKQQLDLNIMKIQEKFAFYVTSVQTIVEEKGVTAKNLSAFLLNLYASTEDSERKLLLADLKAELKDVEDNADIFILLSMKYASHLNPDIFVSILNKYGSKEDQKELNYPEQLKDFVLQHTVKNFSRMYPGLVNPKLCKLAENSKQVRLIFNISRTRSLRTLQEVKGAVAKILGLRASTLRLYSPKKAAYSYDTFTSGTVFSKENNGDTSEFGLQTIREALEDVKTKWFAIGIQLGIPPNKLLEFERECDPLSAVVDYWLRGNVESAVPISWESIVAALKTPHVGEIRFVEKINEQYCQLQIWTPKVSSEGEISDGLKDKGDEESEEEFLRKIVDAFKCGEEIARRLAHAMLIGPPGSGKSSLMLRLLHKEIKKITTSTDVAESIHTVEIRLDEKISTFHSALVVDGKWMEFEFNDSLFSHMSLQQKTAKTQPLRDSSQPNQGTAGAQHLEVSSQPNQDTADTQPLEVSLQSSQALSLQKSLNPSEGLTASRPLLPSGSPKQYRLAESMISYLRKKHGTYKQFKKFLKRGISLYLRDTGGQVEFQEILPLLLFGPSIFLFVFRLDLEFNETFRVKYRQKDSHYNDYASSITLEEALLQCLVTVDITKKTDRAHIEETRKPFVFVIGTHKDLLKKKLEAIENGPTVEEEICQKNLNLDALLKEHGFNSLVSYAGNDPEHVMYTVDNTSEDETDFELIQSRINAVISSRDEFLIQYPINYLLFCFSLMQNVDDNIILLKEFKKRASMFGIEKDEEVSKLLHFLCNRIGIIQHFDKKGVDHLIVNKPQFLYNKVSNFIIETFKGKTLRADERVELEKGILSLKAAESIIGSESEITTEELLDLLVQLRIIARLDDQKFFIPCILNHLPEPSQDIESEDSITAPLYILFGCKYCPKGLFSVLVTYLIGLKHTTLSLKFNEDRVLKDQVCFEVESGDEDLDSLMLKVDGCSSLQISITPEERDRVLIANVCSTIRYLLETFLIKSFKDLHYNMEMVKYEFCLKCKSCSEYHKVLRTNKLRCKKKKIPIPVEGKYWFEGEMSQPTCRPSQDSEAAALISSTQPVSLPHQLSTLGREDFIKINRYLKDLKTEELIELGQTLGLKRATLQKSNPQSLAGDLIDCWLRRDYRVLEESGEPTWHSLATALNSIELNGISKDIQKDFNFSL